MSKRIRIFTPSDVAQHNSASSCWFTRKGKVYDVTDFIRDHPGGEEYILKFAGKDVEDAMTDVDEHVHSDSTYGMLQEFVVGRVGVGETTVSDSILGKELNRSRAWTFRLCDVKMKDPWSYLVWCFVQVHR